MPEGKPAQTHVGYIGEGFSPASDAPYFIVGGVEDLSVDEATGEIKTKRILDRETKASYSFVAVGRSANVRVVVQGMLLKYCDVYINQSSSSRPYLNASKCCIMS